VSAPGTVRDLGVAAGTLTDVSAGGGYALGATGRFVVGRGGRIAGTSSAADSERPAIWTCVSA
jgi:hypothetical protein